MLVDILTTDDCDCSYEFDGGEQELARSLSIHG